MDRRDFLQMGAALALFGTSKSGGAPPVPRVNGGINVQPVRRLDPDAGTRPPLIRPELVDAQMRALYELGFEHIRITISFNRFGPDFLAAIPYARAARALGIDVVGIIGQFTGFDLVQALSSDETRDEVLETYARIFGVFVPAASEKVPRPGRFAVQVLNEPTNFLGISPEFYVREYLRPAYLHLKEDDPSITIVSAATLGSAAGFQRARAMIEAGAELHCDRLAFHVYSRRFIERIATLSNKASWVTETGIEGTENHLGWMTDAYEEIRSRIPNVERLYWFDLFDLTPDGFRLIDLEPRPGMGYEPVPESTAVVERLVTRLGVGPFAPYRELVPDIMLYFPTEEDLELIRSTSFGTAACCS